MPFECQNVGWVNLKAAEIRCHNHIYSILAESGFSATGKEQVRLGQVSSRQVNLIRLKFGQYSQIWRNRIPEKYFSRQQIYHKNYLPNRITSSIEENLVVIPNSESIPESKFMLKMWFQLENFQEGNQLGRGRPVD